MNKDTTLEQVKKITFFLKKNVACIFWINFAYKFHWGFLLLQLLVVDLEIS